MRTLIETLLPVTFAVLPLNGLGGKQCRIMERKVKTVNRKSSSDEL